MGSVTGSHNLSQHLRLTPRQRAAIPQIVAGATDTDVAVKLGLARETVSRWRTNPRFAKALQGARTQALTEALAELRGIALDAVRALRAAIGSKNEAIRVKAALAVLRLLIPLPAANDVEVDAMKDDERRLEEIQSLSLDEMELRFNIARDAVEHAIAEQREAESRAGAAT
jgi:hypothetical protein